MDQRFTVGFTKEIELCVMVIVDCILVCSTECLVEYSIFWIEIIQSMCQVSVRKINEVIILIAAFVSFVVVVIPFNICLFVEIVIPPVPAVVLNRAIIG